MNEPPHFTVGTSKFLFAHRNSIHLLNFRIERKDGTVFDEPLFYSYLALGRLLTDYDFMHILEIGSRNGVAAQAMAFTGKKVMTCEILDTFDAEFSGDYLDLKVEEPFGAIWCSHVLEHQRYLGQFLDKMFDNLKEGGILAVIVPTALHPLLQGHVNILALYGFQPVSAAADRGGNP